MLTHFGKQVPKQRRLALPKRLLSKLQYWATAFKISAPRSTLMHCQRCEKSLNTFGTDHRSKAIRESRNKTLFLQPFQVAINTDLNNLWLMSINEIADIYVQNLTNLTKEPLQSVDHCAMCPLTTIFFIFKIAKNLLSN